MYITSTPPWFQSPIHRVNGCNRRQGKQFYLIERNVSVPYSSGQWLQQILHLPLGDVLNMFQSPIHRVNGCNFYF